MKKGITKQELGEDVLEDLNKIGNLSTLKTENKNNTVEAINEIKNNLNEKVTDEQLFETFTTLNKVDEKIKSDLTEIDKKFSTQLFNIKFYKGDIEPSVKDNESCVWFDTKEEVIKLKENNIWISFGAVYL